MDGLIEFEDGETYLVRHPSWDKWVPLIFRRAEWGFETKDRSYHLSLITTLTKRYGWKIKKRCAGCGGTGEVLGDFGESLVPCRHCEKERK